MVPPVRSRRVACLHSGSINDACLSNKKLEFSTVEVFGLLSLIAVLSLSMGGSLDIYSIAVPTMCVFLLAVGVISYFKDYYVLTTASFFICFFIALAEHIDGGNLSSTFFSRVMDLPLLR